MNAVFVVTPAQVRAAARAGLHAAAAAAGTAAAAAAAAGSQAEADIGSPRIKAWADGGSSRVGESSMDESFEAGSAPGAFPRGLQVRPAWCLAALHMSAATAGSLRLTHCIALVVSASATHLPLLSFVSLTHHHIYALSHPLSHPLCPSPSPSHPSPSLQVRQGEYVEIRDGDTLVFAHMGPKDDRYTAEDACQPQPGHSFVFRTVGHL